jgi:hypothetical protein
MKGVRVAAALCAALALWIGSAGATSAVRVKADTIAMNAQDSSAVINVEGAARLWLDFIIPPGPPCTPSTDGGVDTLIRFMVQVREVLSSGAGTDSTSDYRVLNPSGMAPESLLLNRQYVYGAGVNSFADSTERARALHYAQFSTPAAYSDTTIVVWNPRYNLTNATTGDSVKVGSNVPTIDAPSSSEYIVDIQPNTVKYGNSQRTARVDLINVNTGAPFRAQFVSVRWRLVKGVGVLANNPSVVKVRVVLGRETW